MTTSPVGNGSLSARLLIESETPEGSRIPDHPAATAIHATAVDTTTASKATGTPNGIRRLPRKPTRMIANAMKPIQAACHICAAGRIEMNVMEMPARAPSNAARGVMRRMYGPSTAPSSTITPTINARVKEVRDAKRQGRDPNAGEFVPVEHLRKLAEIKGELAHPEVGPVLIKEQGLRKPEEIWKAAIAWVLQVDPASVEVAKAKHDARKKEEADNKEARKRERAEIKAAIAAKAQAAETA